MCPVSPQPGHSEVTESSAERHLAPLHCGTTTPSGPRGRGARARQGWKGKARRHIPLQDTNWPSSQRAERRAGSHRCQQRSVQHSPPKKNASRPCSGRVTCNWTGLELGPFCPAPQAAHPLALTAPPMKRLDQRASPEGPEGRSQVNSLTRSGPSPPPMGTPASRASGEGVERRLQRWMQSTPVRALSCVARAISGWEGPGQTAPDPAPATLVGS